MQAQSAGKLKAIDVSNWQGLVDWDKVKADGYDFAYFKATEGLTYNDVQLANNVAGAKQAGIPFGVYHFADVNGNDPIVEAKHFVSVWNQYKFDLIPCLDLEQGSLPVDQLVAWAMAWINYVEQATGQIVMIYTGSWFLNAHGQLNNAFATRPLWLSNYSGSAPDGGGWTNWVILQYTDKGVVDGASGNIDLDVAVDLDSLRIKVLDDIGSVTATSGLHVRSLPSSSASVNETLSFGDVVHLTKYFEAEGHGWYATSHGSLGGWVWSQYVDIHPNATSAPNTPVTPVMTTPPVQPVVVPTPAPVVSPSVPSAPVQTGKLPTPDPAMTWQEQAIASAKAIGIFTSDHKVGESVTIEVLAASLVNLYKVLGGKQFS